MQSIGVEHTESSAILVVSNARKYVSQQDFVAIALVNKDILSGPNKLAQGFNLLWSNVDEVKLSELRLDGKCVKRTPRNELLGLFRKMLPRPSKGVNVDMEEGSLPLRRKNSRVSICVFLEDLKLYLRPPSNLVELKLLTHNS